MIERPQTGVLIVIEGIDGAGKTTQARLLAAALADAGLDVVASREPTAGPWGQRIRQTVVSGQRLPFADELAAFIADRTEHQEQVILPALAAGKVVVLDRYFFSTIAYQGIRNAAGADLEVPVRAAALAPDLALVLDLDPRVAAQRIGLRDGVPNVFERLDDQLAIRAIFKRLAQGGDLVEVDAAQTAERLHQDLVARVVDGPLRRRFCAKVYGCDDPYDCGFRLTGTCRWVDLSARLGVTPTAPGHLA
jgi:dTMP kinase